MQYFLPHSSISYKTLFVSVIDKHEYETSGEGKKSRLSCIQRRNWLMIDITHLSIKHYSILSTAEFRYFLVFCYFSIYWKTFVFVRASLFGAHCAATQSLYSILLFVIVNSIRLVDFTDVICVTVIYLHVFLFTYSTHSIETDVKLFAEKSRVMRITLLFDDRRDGKFYSIHFFCWNWNELYYS